MTGTTTPPPLVYEPGHIYVGLDLSLNSPGMVRYTPDSQTIHALFYPTRRKDLTRNTSLPSTWQGRTVFTLVPAPVELTHCTTLQKYNRIAQDILTLVHSHAPERTHIRLEDYAYNMLSSSTSKLHELGGVVKHVLFQAGYILQDVSPSSVKKSFTGHGRATKEQMYTSFLHHGFPDILREFDMQECKGIPNPVQDIVDACALLASFGHK